MVVAVIIFSAFALVVCLLLLWLSLRQRGGVPGPVGLPYLGIALSITTLPEKDILPLFGNWFNKYGSIVKVEMLGNVYILLCEPEHVEQILNSSTHTNKGDWEYSFFKPWLNDGLLLSSGEKWRLRRKLLTNSFHFKILESSLGGISRNADAFAKALLETGGRPTDVQKVIRLATLKIICETAMGVALRTDDEEQNKFIKATETASEGIVTRYLHFWLYPNCIYHVSRAGKKFFRSIHTLQSFAKKVIQKRKKLYFSEKAPGTEHARDKKKAFLDLLLELDESNPGFFSEADIQEEVDTFMFEGHDTVSAALIFSHFLLANHPDVQEKAFNEQYEIFGTDKRPPTIQELQKMTYLEMVIKETLRLYPSVPFHSRRLFEDLRIDENTVAKAGQSIGILTFFVHRSKNHWDDPEKFMPERFAPGAERHPFSYIPFSAGPRNCIGQKFAMVEMKTLLSAVLRNCVLEAVTTSVIPVASVIIRSLDPVVIRVLPRKDPVVEA